MRYARKDARSRTGEFAVGACFSTHEFLSRLLSYKCGWPFWKYRRGKHCLINQVFSQLSSGYVYWLKNVKSFNRPHSGYKSNADGQYQQRHESSHDEGSQLKTTSFGTSLAPCKLPLSFGFLSFCRGPSQITKL